MATGVSIGFDGEFSADIARWHAVAIAVEGEPDIFVDQRFGRVAVIGQQSRQRSQRLRLKTFIGWLAGFAVLALVGDLLSHWRAWRSHRPDR